MKQGIFAAGFFLWYMHVCTGIQVCLEEQFKLGYLEIIFKTTIRKSLDKCMNLCTGMGYRHAVKVSQIKE
jgi:hypothetical protein